MEKSQMRNIVVLKNLPSNLVEEAIIILKSNKIARKFEYIEHKESVKKENSNSKTYIIREAENLISNYIDSVENKEKNKNTTCINKKYKYLKIYSIVVTIILLFAIVI